MCTTTDAPSRSISLPADIADLLRDAETRNLTGHITLHYVQGEVGATEIKAQRTTRKDLTRTAKRA